MTGDYTKVPLRADERWTFAPIQQARVLLEHESNLNLAAIGRARADEIVDVVGPAGFAGGSQAFEVLAVTVDGAGARNLTIGAGHAWVGGLEPYAPAQFAYLDQDQVVALPAQGSAFVWLDVWCEHVQPAEDPEELIDPALAPIDSAGAYPSRLARARYADDRGDMRRGLRRARFPFDLGRDRDDLHARHRPCRPIPAHRPATPSGSSRTDSSASRYSTRATPHTRGLHGRSTTERRPSRSRRPRAHK